MADKRQVYRVEITVRQGQGDQRLDEIDVERLILGEVDWGDRIHSVRAEKLEEEEVHESENAHQPRYVGPVRE